ncbi:hypothetical protein GF345_04995 [Candidatus Woesearchaeota archaeon]|nr:hypothetical protein [Candidatus Woesearchaeota archaeon]
MKLYPLLTDKDAINLLKALYDNEVLEKKSYTTKLSDVGSKARLKSRGTEAAEKLSSYNLIALDSVDNDYIMSITNRGKEFIEIFDQLVELMNPKSSGQRSISIKYELTNHEKKILILTYKMSKESGSDFIPMKMLVEELYPVNQAGKSGVVSRCISKLEEIGLMERQKQGRKTLVCVTEKGFKTIRQQYLKGLMH